jgi:predicted SpoU family rRNA methylase
VEKVIREFAGKHGMQVEEGMVRNLIAFAMTGEKVDYQLLVSKFKDLSVEISEFPKRKVF